MNEAEQDMKNSADQGGCYPRRQVCSVNGLICSGSYLTSFWRHRFHNLQWDALLTSLVQMTKFLPIWSTAAGYGEYYAWFAGGLLSTQEARVALGHCPVRLLRFFRA